MLNELDQPTFIEVVVGRDGSRGESSCARPPSQNPSSGFPATGSPGCAREMAIRLRLRSDLVRLCGHLSPTSECRECFPRPATQPAPPLPHVRGFPALRVLSASPTSTVASVSLRLVHSVDILGPIPPSQDSGGSPRCHDASISVRAVLLDPAGVSNDHRPLRSLTVAFQVFDPVGLRMCHEAQSLHLRYGLDIALSTLNSCRCLHEPKTRFPVRRLIPLPGREFHPLKAPGLTWRTEKSPNVSVKNIIHLPPQERIRQRI